MASIEAPFLNAVVLIDREMQPFSDVRGDRPAPPFASTQVKFAKYYLSRHFKGAFHNTIKNRTLLFRDLRVMAINPDVAVRFRSYAMAGEINATQEPSGTDGIGDLSSAASGGTEAASKRVQALQEKGCNAHLDKFVPRLIAWVQKEAEMTPAYRRACRLLQSRARTALRHRRYEDCRAIIDGFGKIAGGNAAPGPAATRHAASVLGQMVDEDLANQLIKDFTAGDHPLRESAGECLVSLGTVTAERLLSILIVSENRDERLRIIRVLSQIGLPMASLVSKEIRQGGPWYYIRNLALLLAEVGNASHFGALLPLLRHSDRRVQREALYAIGKTRWRCGYGKI